MYNTQGYESVKGLRRRLRPKDESHVLSLFSTSSTDSSSEQGQELKNLADNIQPSKSPATLSKRGDIRHNLEAVNSNTIRYMCHGYNKNLLVLCCLTERNVGKAQYYCSSCPSSHSDVSYTPAQRA
jgi:hypothetical protein